MLSPWSVQRSVVRRRRLQSEKTILSVRTARLKRASDLDVLLVDLEVTRSGRDDGEGKSSSNEVAIDVVLVERVDGEIDDLEKVALMGLREQGTHMSVADALPARGRLDSRRRVFRE